MTGWCCWHILGAGSESGRSRRTILVEPRQTGWHSWQSGGWRSFEADTESSEYTRPSCNGLDRLACLAKCYNLLIGHVEVEAAWLKRRMCESVSIWSYFTFVCRFIL